MVCLNNNKKSNKTTKLSLFLPRHPVHPAEFCGSPRSKQMKRLGV